MNSESDFLIGDIINGTGADPLESAVIPSPRAFRLSARHRFARVAQRQNLLEAIGTAKPIPTEAPSDARLAKMRQAVDQIRENIQTRGAWVNLLAGARGLVAAGEYVEACILLEVLAAISLGWWCRCRLGKGVSPGKSVSAQQSHRSAGGGQRAVEAWRRVARRACLASARSRRSSTRYSRMCSGCAAAQWSGRRAA